MTVVDIRDAVATSHTVATKVEVWSGQTIAATIYPTSGSVSIDAERAVRRSCSLQFVDYDGTLTPTTADSLLAPGNNELRIYRGVRTADGTNTYAPLGVFVITDVTLDATESGVEISITGEDRARLIRDKKWRKPKKLTAGANIADVLEEVATDAQLIPSLTVVIDKTSRTTPTTHTITIGAGLNADPWGDLETIAKAAGFAIWFDEYGVLRGGPHPTFEPSILEGSTVATYEPGENSTLLGVSRSLSAEQVFNGIRVTAEGSGIPLDGGLIPSGEALDTDALSPTNTTILGERVDELSTPMVGTSADAQAVADLLLPAYKGWPVTFNVVPDPTLDVRDVVWLRYPRMYIDSAVIIDALDVPLAAGDSMSVTGRIARIS